MANEIELGTGLLQYGEFTFPSAIHAKVRSRSQQDSTGRFTKYVEHELEIECVLYPGADADYYGAGKPGVGAPKFPTNGTSADAGMEQVRQILTTRGLPLIFRDKGFGPFEINTVTDEVSNGPTPQLLAWEPIGDNYAVRIVWEVSVAIADCSLAVGDQRNRILEFAYAVDWGIDRLGLTTRTTTGFWQIVLDIANGSVRNNADGLRDRFRVTLPSNFNRIQQTYTLNARRDRMDFTIVDQEHPADDKNPYPAGVVDLNINHTVTSNDSVLTNYWTSLISGTITVAKGQPRYLAWIAFLNVVDQRQREALNKGNNAITSRTENTAPGEEKSEPNEDKKVIIPGRLSISEEIYGRRMRFSYSFTHFSTLKLILEAASIWQPIEGEPPISQTTQSTSLLSPGEAWTVRGFKGLRHQRGELLVGLCQQQDQSIDTSAGRIKNTEDQYNIFKCAVPTEENSWLLFDPLVKEFENTNRYTSYRSLAAVRQSPDPTLQIGSSGNNRSRLGPSASDGVSQLGVVHQSGPTSHRILFYGAAARLGYPIGKVYLRKYGGAEVTASGEHWQEDLPPVDLGGCLLYRTKWRREYRLLEQPTGNNVISDPSPESINATRANRQPISRFLNF